MFRSRFSKKSSGEAGDNSSETTQRASEPENNDQNEQNGQTEQKNSDEEQQDSPPTPVGFWDSRLKHVRHEAMLKWILTTGILMFFIIGLLSLYWSSFLHIDHNLHTLTAFVVDFDGRIAPYENNGVQPLVGPLVTQLAEKMTQSSMPTIGWTIKSAADFNNDPIVVRQAVFDYDAWVAIIINANATSLLRSAVQNGNASYEPIGACQLVYVQARDDQTFGNYIMPQVQAFMTAATSMVGEQWAKALMQEAAFNTSIVQSLSRVPQAVSPAIGFSTFNLRPFVPYQATPAVSIGLIYLIIVSFFSFAFYLPIHQKYLKPEGHPPLKFWQLIIWRWFATISAYFMLSLAYSLVSLAFQINFAGGNPVTSETAVTVSIDGYSNPDAYGHGSFPVYWMLNFFGMIAVGFACENMAMIVGQPWMGLFLVFWVISNVVTSFYSIQLQPAFFDWGYAWPLHQIVEGSRQVLFGLHSELGLNFGILIAWGAVNSVLFPFACYFMRWKSNHHVNEYYR